MLYPNVETSIKKEIQIIVLMILEKNCARIRAVSHNIAAYLRLFGYGVSFHRDTVVAYASQEQTLTSSFHQTADFARNHKTLAVSLDVTSPLDTDPIHLSLYYRDSLHSCLLLEVFGDPRHVSMNFPALLAFAQTHNFCGADVPKEIPKQFLE
jgi:hypothetical protein